MSPHVPSVAATLLPAAAVAGLAALAPLGRADVLVVDASNGPGADFTAIGAAIAAAADGDVLLVRDGLYSFALVDGKSLVIQAEATATVTVDGGITVRNLGAGQSVVVRGIDAVAGQLGAALDVSNCAGAVLVEDAELSGTGRFVPFPGGGVAVTSSASLVLARSTVHPFEHQFLNPGLLVNGSTVTLHASTVHGVKGFDQAGPPNAGGKGVRLAGSTLRATDSTIVGGAGGDYTGAPSLCADGGAGGTGLELVNGSSATLYATDVLGGPGGLTSGTCSVGPTGPTTDVDGTSSLAGFAQGLGEIVVESPVRSGVQGFLSVTAEGGAFAWALFGPGVAPALTTPSLLGPLHVPLPLHLAPLGVLPLDSGNLGVSFTLVTPPGTEALEYWFQPLTFSPTDHRLRVGSGSWLTLLDASF